MSSAFHSQTNDQIERQNQTLKQYLRNVINFLQNDWIDHFSLAKYIYNDFHHSVIQISLFRVNTERHSISFALHFYHEKRFSTNVEKTTKKIVKLQKQLTKRLIEAQNYQAKYYDKKHTQLVFNEENKIMLRLTNLKTERLIKKLNIRLTKSFVIERVINSQFYKLKLSSNFKIHFVFHVELLERYKKNEIKERMISFSFSIEIVTQKKNENTKWKVDQIVKSRKRREKIQYFVQWKNYENTAESRSWQTVEKVKNVNELIKKFHEKHSLMSAF